MPFRLANAGSLYIRMLDVAMKEVDWDFWTSYLDDILTYSGEPWAHFRHLSQVVLAHAAAGDLMIQEYMQKIKDWPVPKPGKEVVLRSWDLHDTTEPSYLSTQS